MASQLNKQIEASIPPDLTIKPHAQILFTATDYYGSCSSRIRMSGESVFKQQPSKCNFVNGMTGTILSIKDGSMIVKTEKGDYLEVSPMTRPLYAYKVDSKKFVKVKAATATQYPFIPAYSLTIHRSQGQTLNWVIVDPSVFAPGQLYVALSRVRSIENLVLTRKIQPEDLLVDQEVLRFYERAEKLAGLSKQKGRPAKNTDGSRRSVVIWVPAALETFVKEEVRQNRIIELASLPEKIPGRKRIRVTEDMAPRIKAQIDEWSKTVKKKNRTVKNPSKTQ